MVKLLVRARDALFIGRGRSVVVRYYYPQNGYSGNRFPEQWYCDTYSASGTQIRRPSGEADM